MKKSLIALVGMIGLAVTAPATAVQKCVALNSSGTTCTFVDPGYYVVDWTSNCTTSGTSVPIKGIGVCAANAGSAAYETADALTLNSDASTHVNCWCKMTSPAVSSWVFYRAYTSAGYCANLCANSCAYYAAYFSAFRSALFSVLGD